MNRNVVPQLPDEVVTPQSGKLNKKPEMNFVQSIRFVFSSPYILKIGVIVVSYSTAMTLLEIYFLNTVSLFVRRPF
jgi:ATP/ADP translocase